VCVMLLLLRNVASRQLMYELHRHVAVTVDKLPIADDDEAPMASAPPSHTMDVIQGYDAVAMDDGNCCC